MNSQALLRRTLAASAATLLVTAGCGKKGPLLYPDSLVAQPPQQVSVAQRGASLRLSFVVPQKDLAGHRLKDVEAVRILRRVCRAADCRGCQEPFQPLQRIGLAFPGSAERIGNQLSWLDSDVRIGETFQYRLQAEQKDGILGDATDTSPARVGVMAAAPQVSAAAVFGGAIRIDVAGLTPGGLSLVGYTLLRREGQGPFSPLATLASGVSRYEDQAVQLGKQYQYAARLIAKRRDGLIVESELSPVVTVNLTDSPD